MSVALLSDGASNGLDPLYGFVLVGLFSPGPNVILLTASGARFGFVRTLPHLAGVVLGVGVTSGLTGLGIGAVLAARPALEMTLKIVAAAWILKMAYDLWHARAGRASGTAQRPMRFHEAVLFQWVNPKVWAVALAAAAAYPSGLPPEQEALRLAGAFSGINFFVCLFWTSFGAGLRYLLSTPAAWRLFTRVMAFALAVFSVMVFL